jgi:hypothetical protein
MATPPRRIPPPPTRFGLGTGQPKPGLRPAPGAFAPPPPHWRAPPARHIGVAPAPALAVQRQRRVAGTGRVGIIQRAAATSSAIPQSKRPVVKCTMGQGVTGYLDRVVLASDQFSTCSPIIMYNAKSRFAGLFHFAASGLEKQKVSLRTLHDRVRPTVIYLNDRSVKFEWMKRISHDHVEQQEFFEDECGYTGKFVMIAVKGDSYAVTLDDADEILLSNTTEFTAELDYSSNQPNWVTSTSLSGGELDKALEGVGLVGKNLW